MGRGHLYNPGPFVSYHKRSDSLHRTYAFISSDGYANQISYTVIAINCMIAKPLLLDEKTLQNIPKLCPVINFHKPYVYSTSVHINLRHYKGL